MEYNEVVDLCKRSATCLDANLLMFGDKITGKDKRIEISDKWEGEDGYVAKKMEMSEIVRERWDQEDDEKEDADSKAPRRPESEVYMHVEKGMECAKEREQQVLVNVEKRMKEGADFEKQKRSETNEVHNEKTLKENDKERTRLEEMNNIILLSRQNKKKRKRRRRPYEKKNDKIEDSEVLPNEKSREMDRLEKDTQCKLEKELLPESREPSKNEKEHELCYPESFAHVAQKDENGEFEAKSQVKTMENDSNGSCGDQAERDPQKLLFNRVMEELQLTFIIEKKPRHPQEISLKKEVEDEDLRNTEEPNANWEEESVQNNLAEPRSKDDKDNGKLGLDTGHATAAADNDKHVDEDEDDEEDDDFFVPRKLFFFSFTHFKDEEHCTARA